MILALFWTTVFMFGASIGSFLNVCVLRWPAGESVVRPRSRCPACARQIRWYENIPVASWVALRATCAGCGHPISIRYPAVELLVGLGWLACGLTFGPGFTALRVAVFGTILFGIAITDLEHYLIPDGFTVFGLAWALLTAFLGGMVPEVSPFAGPLDAIVGACVGAGAIAIAGWLGEVALKREAMGFGDVTLMAFAGAALGPTRSLLTVFVGAAIGAVIFLAIVIPVTRARRSRAPADIPPSGGAAVTGNDDVRAPGEPPLVPFGVFLAPAALITLLWGDAMVTWYLRLLMT